MEFQLSLENGRFLVKLARKTVREYIEKQKISEVPKNTPRKLREHCGVFVTLNKIVNKKEELRGCIGIPYPSKPLVGGVIESAINSALHDPRFHPVSSEELDQITFEVSVLTPPQLVEVDNPIDYPSKIRVGQDGLIIEKGYNRGLLLPQVPIEWEWNEEEFLSQCCIKAGLPLDNWLLKETKVYRFQAIIFEEIFPNGKIEIKKLR